jgi:hypothetical protein
MLKVLNGFSQLTCVNGNVGQGGSGAEPIIGFVAFDLTVVGGSGGEIIATCGRFAGNQHGLYEE